MKWYKRLFWKVFAAIWTVSFVVVAGSVVVVGLVSESDRIREVTLARAEGYANLMIRTYEQNGYNTVLPMLPRSKRRDYDHHDDRDDDHEDRERYIKKSDRHRKPPFDIVERVTITDSTLKQSVVAGPVLPRRAEDQHSFTLVSNQGRSYQVDVDLSWDRSPFARLLSLMLSIQMLLVLLISGLAALLVSAIIVRPLNQLRAHTQALYQGDLGQRTDEKLSKRGDELGELAREFDQMAEYVERTLTSHQRLMQDVSHELRAPLARLQAAAGLAEQQLGENHKLVERIQRECERLDQLIGEILSLSRLEQEESSGQRFSLRDLLEELCDDARFAYPQRPIRVEVSSMYPLKLNRKLLERALGNVLSNACKHTAVDTAIELGVVHEGGQIKVLIRDHGPGVAEEQLAHLCDPFFRNGSQNEGYGLGLSIAKRALERLGGQLQLRNHPHGGLEVTLLLPDKVLDQG